MKAKTVAQFKLYILQLCIYWLGYRTHYKTISSRGILSFSNTNFKIPNLYFLKKQKIICYKHNPIMGHKHNHWLPLFTRQKCSVLECNWVWQNFFSNVVCRLWLTNWQLFAFFCSASKIRIRKQDFGNKWE